MLRVPRHMEIYRRGHWETGHMGDGQNGCFVIPSRGMVIVAASGQGWDHVSISHRDRTPTWEEMEWAKREFFEDNDTVIQIHPPLKDYVNNHPYVLHLWRPWNVEIPLPPKGFI